MTPDERHANQTPRTVGHRTDESAPCGLDMSTMHHMAQIQRTATLLLEQLFHRFGVSKPDAQSPTDLPTADLTPDDVHSLLSATRRRYVIQYVAHDLNHGDTVELGDLAEYVAALEHNTVPADITSDERKTVYIALYQIHLPKLADAGIIEWNRRDGEIGRGHSVDGLATLIEKTELACLNADAMAHRVVERDDEDYLYVECKSDD